MKYLPFILNVLYLLLGIIMLAFAVKDTMRLTGFMIAVSGLSFFFPIIENLKLDNKQ